MTAVNLLVKNVYQQQINNYHRKSCHSIIRPIGDGGVSVSGGLEARVRLNVRRGQSNSGGLCGGGVRCEHIVVASVANQLLLSLLDEGWVWFQQLGHYHLCLHLEIQ